jgi:hypothetical protein
VDKRTTQSSRPAAKPLSRWSKRARKTAISGQRGQFVWYFILRGVKCSNPNLRGLVPKTQYLGGLYGLLSHFT